MVKLLGPERVTHVCTDDYHKYDRRERAQLNITALHPDCNYLDILELQLERLHYGQPILKPVYDHSTGMLVRPEYVQPREFVIVEGLLGFHTTNMRQFYDVKVYLGPPEDLRSVWKIKRDTTKRGYTAGQVLEQAIWQHLPDLRPLRADAFGDYSDRAEMRHSDPLALTQLLLTCHLLRQYGDVAQLPFAIPVAALSRLEAAPAGVQAQSE